jgi:nitrous oxidase accessory protein NosD
MRAIRTEWEYKPQEYIKDTAFEGATLDFRRDMILTRFDRCIFVDCTFLVDDKTDRVSLCDCMFEGGDIGALLCLNREKNHLVGNYFDDNVKRISPVTA